MGEREMGERWGGAGSDEAAGSEAAGSAGSEAAGSEAAGAGLFFSPFAFFDCFASILGYRLTLFAFLPYSASPLFHL